MIVVYPMLISQSVSPNVLPGLVKAVEKYIIVYNTDAILKTASRTTAGKIIATGGKILAGTAAAAAAGAAYKWGGDIAGYLPGPSENTDLSEVSVKQTFKSGARQVGTAMGQAAGQELEALKKPSKGPIKSSLDIPRNDAVSLEPTWINITTEKKGLQILGVKVVPFQIKSSANIGDLLTNDAQLKKLTFLSTKFGRSITRVLNRLYTRLKSPIFGRGVTGDPKKDIIYGGTQYKDNMFVALNQLDLDESDVFSNPAGVQKLHKLGWASFIILDDVNRRSTFCMKEFGGICSVVPYNFIFASLGKDVNKAYEDLEDLKKSAGPFFNMRTNRKRAFSESRKMGVTDKYLDLIQQGK